MNPLSTIARTAALGALGAMLVGLLGAGSAAAQERSSATARSEIIDPFPRATRAAAAITEIVVELIDPFEGAPPRATAARSASGRASAAAAHTEIVDPFRTGVAAASEILDPWAP
ncbi:MAG: hypothetical protein K1X94_05975 [Sandaracinaceae bacterium]|jgi:hypothetical protein|nr:hypothetical protein [Sandaracinaceae bacterium]